jgi:hypothetical protein
MKDHESEDVAPDRLRVTGVGVWGGEEDVVTPLSREDREREERIRLISPEQPRRPASRFVVIAVAGSALLVFTVGFGLSWPNEGHTPASGPSSNPSTISLGRSHAESTARAADHRRAAPGKTPGVPRHKQRSKARMGIDHGARPAMRSQPSRHPEDPTPAVATVPASAPAPASPPPPSVPAPIEAQAPPPTCQFSIECAGG